MAINIKFDLAGNPEPPTIILANRNGNKFGQLEVETNSVELKDSINDASEISFTLNKYIDGRLTNLWDKVVDFKLIYCKEWDMWFEIKVELDEATKTIKTVFGTQLGKAELSQIMLYNIEINTEKDIERDDYKISILYDANDPESSILNRVLEKAPHYSIAYVDPDVATTQRSFSFDDTSICDAFQEIAESIDCVFVYHSGSDENGMPQRAISVYSSGQYGEDTLIFVTSDELATEGIRLTTDTDAVKNCYKLEAGDELMTATVRNCNPSGTDYIWCFADKFTEDMSDELVSKLGSYSGLHEHYANDYVSDIDSSLLNEYNSLTNKYSAYNEDLQVVSVPIKGYASLMNAHYNTIDLALYLKSGLMPSVSMSGTNAEEQARLLTSSSLSPVAVTDMKTVSLATANSAVLAMAKIVVRSTFKVQVSTSELSEDKKTWTGNFVVTNYSDEEDTAISETISVEVNDNLESFIKQKIDKALNKENTDDLSISGLFENEYDNFCVELQKYSLNSLTSFRDACQACIDILIEQGVANDESWSDDTEGSESNLYEKLYVPYYNKLTAIEAEIQVRENEISIIEELQKEIANSKKQIHEDLDFEKYLGENLWIEFSSYRREGKYSNENYISDGLNNTELFNKAAEFITAAEGEIYSSSELQHSISTTLNNLLAIPKFKPLVNSFETGNWIRVQVNNEIYRLRLISYEISYGDFNNISVEFSDVIKIGGGVASVKTILSKASSMASTYEEIKKQSEQGDKANGTIEQWLADGLNSALVRISNNDNEEITITKNGLLGRSYDDVADDYSPEQFKLTHNIMAYTTDNWKTVSTALGKHGYVYWDGKNFVNDVDYGLSTKFVNAGYINGSQIISGEIASSNYKPNESGTYLNLNNGEFEFAGGKIVYDVKENGESTLTLKGVTIQWDSLTDKPTVENIDGLSGVTDDIRAIEQGLQATTINGQYVISPHIVGGDLKIVGNNGTTSAQISNNGILTATGANITGDITATSLTLGSGVKISTEDIDGIDEYAKIGDIVGVPDNIITAEDVIISESTTANGVTTQTITVGDNEYTSIISGDFVFTDIGLGTDTEDGSKRYTCIAKDGLLTAKNAIIYGTIYATAGKFTGDITANSLSLASDMKIGTEANGYYTWISTEGVLNARGANIDGDSTFSGTITASNIIGNSTLKVGQKSDENGNLTYSTQISEDGIISAVGGVFEDCTITGGSLKMGNIEDGYSAWISVENGILNANGANISGEIIATSGSFTDGTFNNCTIEDTCSIKGELIGATGTFSGTISASTISGGSLRIENEGGTTYAEISNDGVLNAVGANISGVINITEGGSIGGWNITTDGITKDTVGLLSGSTYSGDSLLTEDATSSVRFYAGKTSRTYTKHGLAHDRNPDVYDGYVILHYDYHVLPDLAAAQDVTLKFIASVSFTHPDFGSCSEVHNIDYDYEEGTVYIDVKTTYQWYTDDIDTWIDITLEYDVDFNTKILEDGSFYTKAANITGDIDATSAKFGVCEIKDDGYITTHAFIENDIEHKETDITMQKGALSSRAFDYAASATGLYDTSSHSVELNFGELRFERHINRNGDNVSGLEATFGWYIGDGEWIEDGAYRCPFIIQSGDIILSGTKGGGQMWGYWQTVESLTNSSWRGGKHDIESLPDKYSVLFDNLKPVRFKYNHGTSDRYHTGLVLDELGDAMNIADVDSSELAAYCVHNAETGEGGIRYSELIALNIAEIQKLKKRVAELESK